MGDVSFIGSSFTLEGKYTGKAKGFVICEKYLNGTIFSSALEERAVLRIGTDFSKVRN